MTQNSSEWKEYRIDELGQVVTGHTPLKSVKEYYEGNDYTWIKPTDIRKGERYVLETDEYYSQKAFEKYKKALLPPLSTCVVTIGTVGEKICLTHKPCFTNQSINAIIPNREKFDPMFVYYLLKYNLDQVAQRNPGTASGRHHVSKSNISSIIVKAPTKSTQLKISTILARYDDLLENNTRRIRILEEMAQAIYREWFVHFRFPGHEGVRMVESELGLIPEGWEVKPLSEYGQIVTGKTPSKVIDEYFGGSVPFIKIPDMHEGFFIINTGDTLSIKGERSQKQKTLPPNSICVSCIGTGGLVGITCKNSQTNQQINSIVLNNQNYREYLYFSLRMLKETIINYGLIGATMVNLNRQKFSSLIIVNPPQQMIIKYHQSVEDIFEQILLFKLKNQNLRQTRDLLLPKLISGELDVSELDIIIPGAIT